jgi:hypothetical protein
MISGLQKQSNRVWTVLGRGFANGIGCLGNFIFLDRPEHERRRYRLAETTRRRWRTDSQMIHQDFEMAFSKFHE